MPTTIDYYLTVKIMFWILRPTNVTIIHHRRQTTRSNIFYGRYTIHIFPFYIIECVYILMKQAEARGLQVRNKT